MNCGGGATDPAGRGCLENRAGFSEFHEVSSGGRPFFREGALALEADRTAVMGPAGGVGYRWGGLSVGGAGETFCTRRIDRPRFVVNDFLASF